MMSREPGTLNKIAMVMIAAVDDGTWGTAGYEGLQRIKKLLGVETLISECVPRAEWESAIRNYASMGCDLVLIHGAELSEAARSAAMDYPATLFACVNGAHIVHNLASFSMDDEALGYLAGALAARMSVSGVVGHIGGLRIPTTEAQALGFQQGAQAGGANALTIFTGEFSDADKAKQAAVRQADQGADVFYFYLKEAGAGVLQLCDLRGLHAIAAITDQQDLAPAVLYSSAIQNVGLLHFRAAELALQGKLQGIRYRIGLENPEAQGLAPLHNVPEGVQEELDHIRDQILSGEIVIQRRA
jgi:basic membrane protein A and related proteins